MDELKPCPFCGSPAVLSPKGSHAACSGRGCTVWVRVEKWNARAPTGETARADAAERLIAVSKGLACPNCDNEGFTPEQDGYGEGYQCQCEFCYTVKDSVFNRRQAEDKP